MDPQNLEDACCSNHPKKSRVWDSVYCSHCKQLVSKSTYYRHRTISQCQADPRPTLNDEPAAHDSVDKEETMSDVGSYTDSMEDIEDIIGFVYSVDLSQVSTKIIDSYYHAVT